jgi:hypothetical protein
MIRLRRVFRSAGVALCLMFMLSACVVESDVTQTPSDPTVSDEDKAHRTTPEPATAAPMSPKLRPGATLIVKTLDPNLAIIREEEKMTPTTNVSPGLQKLVDLAVADLAQRLSIAADQIDVMEVKAVVWPDGGLGCPEPGIAYTQVQREGLLIRLRVEERLYNYHSGGGREPFLCEKPVDYDKLPTSPGFGNE